MFFLLFLVSPAAKERLFWHLGLMLPSSCILPVPIQLQFCNKWMCTNLLWNSWSCTALPVAGKDALWLKAENRGSWILRLERVVSYLKRPWSSSVTHVLQLKLYMIYVYIQRLKKTAENSCLPFSLVLCSTITPLHTDWI